MKERFKLLRQHFGLTQAEFAAQINLTRNYVAMIEIGQREPSDRTISDICRIFGVNEAWLRDGEGEMLRPKSRGEEIGEVVKAAATSDPEEAAAFFRSILDGMSDGEILLLYEIVKKHFPGK